MLIFPMVNTRRDGEGVGWRWSDVRLLVSPAVKESSKHRGLGARAARSWFPSSVLPDSATRRKQAPSLVPSPPLPATRPTPPPPGSLPRLPRWELATCPSDLAEYLSGFDLPTGMTSRDTMTLTIQIWPPDSSLKLHKIAIEDLRSVKTSCSQGNVVLRSHSGPVPSYFHTMVRISATRSPNRGKTWNAKINGAGRQTQAGLLTALRSEGGQEGRRQENDEMRQIFPIARDHWWGAGGCQTPYTLQVSTVP